MEGETPKGVGGEKENEAAIVSETPGTMGQSAPSDVVSSQAPLMMNETKPRSVKPTPWPLIKLLGQKYFRPIVGVAVVGLLILLAYTQRGLVVAALVNGSPISRLSVVEELEKQAGKRALDDIITKKLITTEIKKAGIIIEPTAIDAEMKKIGDQVMGQGGTLAQALAQQGMTESDLREQIVIQKSLEVLLADKIAVSDDEVTEYLKKSMVPPTEGTNSDDARSQAREQLKIQKFPVAAGAWLGALKDQATIDYFVSYGE